MILSENSGMREIIEEGKNGFVVPIQSTEALIGKIRFFIRHPEQIRPMGERAREMAERYTWQEYSARVRQCCINILRREQENASKNEIQ